MRQIQQGQDPLRKRKTDGGTAVHCLCEKVLSVYRSDEELAAVKQVLRILAGPNPKRLLSEPNNFGQTALHLAASNIHLLREVLALSQNSGINVADCRGSRR